MAFLIRRYARTYVIGVHFGITIDDIIIIIKNVCNRHEQWEDIVKRYPAFEQAKKEEKKENEEKK